jgi:hypothetical protein
LLRFYRLLWTFLLLIVTTPAFAQYTRDTAANKKIDEAINTHYVATDFEKAEGVLLGTINACGDKCSPQTMGKAWMYVGIVRGSGKNNQAGAKEAFQKAVAADPGVKLDTVLATPETQATFAAVGGTGSAAAPEPVAPSGPAAPAAAPKGGGLTCTPAVTNVETRRPIPIQCSSDEEVTSMELKYKPFGADAWKTMPMQKKGDSFRVQLPCTATGTAGALKLYVRAKDPQGEQIDSWGSKQAPIVINLAEAGVTEEPPAFDDGEAPPRCAAKEECPPDFPGCGEKKVGGGRGEKDWGAACSNSVECKSGLLCDDGTCQAAPSCETAADCTTGVCNDGKCDLPEGAGEAGAGAGGLLKKNWLSLNIAQDFAFVGGYNVCDPKLGQQSDNYACFYQGTSDQPFFHTPYPLKDAINTGAARATTRILVGFDRAFTPRITAGARVGFAIGGGPPAGQQAPKNVKDPPPHQTGTGGTPFLPLHFEVRGAFWFLPLTAKLLRAYALVGGGMAQVDAKVSIDEYDCEEAKTDAKGNTVPNFDPKNPTNTMPDPATSLSPYEQCRSGKRTFYNYKTHKATPVDAWKKMGQGFVEGGVGAMLAVAPNMGVTLEGKMLYMLPASGVVLQPSLGFAYGF